MAYFSQGFGGPRQVQSESSGSWLTLIDGSTATTALANPTITATAPSIGSGICQAQNYRVVRLLFGGTDAANETINYQVVLWRQGHGAASDTPAWVPLIAAKGTVTLGTGTYALGTGLGATGNLIADTVTDQIGKAHVHSPANNTEAVLTVPVENASYVEVEVDLGTAASSDVFIQLGEDGAIGATHRPPLAAFAKDTWHAFPTPLSDYYQIVLSDDTASETGIVSLWGSNDAGTTYWPLLRADTLAMARTVSLAVGTSRIGAAGNYTAAIAFARGPASHFYVEEETSPAAGTYSYLVGGVA